MGQTSTRPMPQVVAHRGASEARPEHTEDAYLQAIADGADALECDVRLTADHHLVCLHDRRIDRTADGNGIVSTLTLAQLQDRDFGTWRGQPGPGVLTLDELLDLAAAAPRPVGVVIETKHPNRFAGAVETELAETLIRRGLVGNLIGDTRVRVMSFSVLAMRRMGDRLPDLDRVLLNEMGLNPQVRAGFLPDRIGGCGISTTLLRRDPAIVVRQQRNNNRVSVYTVDTDEDLKRCVDTGVDVIITNRPARVRAGLAQMWDSR